MPKLQTFKIQFRFDLRSDLFYAHIIENNRYNIEFKDVFFVIFEIKYNYK